MAKSILIVEDEETLRESIKRIFTKEGYAVDGAESAEKGLILLETNHYDVIISDIILPGMDGIEMLARVREQNPDQIVIIVTAYASLDTSVKALRAGAYDYIMKPIIHEEIKQIVRNALKQKSLQTENKLLKRQIDREYDFSSIIGTSPALKDILDEVKKITDARSNVLILGETGTGKELFARVIHHNSPRRDMPFVPINCSAIPENLLESELFGHVRGAFTGAIATKKGIRVSRRNRRYEHGAPGKAAPRHRRPGYPARGQHEGDQGRHPLHHRHEQGPEGGGQERIVPGGPVLPHQRNHPQYPAAPGAEGGHRSARAVLSRMVFP
jgi:DNA-binding NtrC family response regulator